MALAQRHRAALRLGTPPTGGSVNAEVGYRVFTSAELVLLATVLSVVIGVGLGVVSALHQYRPADRILQSVSVILYNVPTVVAALFLVFGAIRLNDAVGRRIFFVTGSSSPDVTGFWATLGDTLAHLLLPTICLTVLGYVGYHLTQRSLLLDTINADFVRTARATGLTRAQAVRRHALRASLIPTATSVAFSIPGIFTGAVLTESIFGWHGMGEYFTLTLSKKVNSTGRRNTLTVEVFSCGDEGLGREDERCARGCASAMACGSGVASADAFARAA